MKNSREKKFPHTETTARKSRRPEKLKETIVSRLNRIEGQVRATKRMIEGDTYCDDVLNLISSIQSALNGVGKALLEYHLKSCVVKQIQEGEISVIDELMKTIHKLIK